MSGGIQKINAFVLGIYGALDHGLSTDKVRAFEDCMNAAGKRVGIRIYKGAGHALESPTNRVAIGQRPLPTPGATGFSSSSGRSNLRLLFDEFACSGICRAEVDVCSRSIHASIIVG